MAIYGGYETVSSTADTGLVTVWTARPVGAESDELEQFVVKVFHPIDFTVGEQEDKAGLKQFLDAARLQRELAQGKGEHWAPIHDAGTHEDEAYYVTDYYAHSAEDLMRVQLDTRTIHVIVESVVFGLQELKQERGRPHGNLKASNVLITSGDDISRTRVYLTDPLPGERLDLSAAIEGDVAAVGELIYQLVLHKAPQRLGQRAVAPSEAWQRLGRKGERWRELCSQLLMNPGDFTLEQIAEQLEPLREAAASKGPILAVAGVLVLAIVAGVAFFVINRNGGGNGGNGPQAFSQERWQHLCHAYLYWFAAFQSEMTEARRVRWRADPELEKIVQAFQEAESRRLDPREIAGQPSAILQDLMAAPPEGAKTRNAVQETNGALAVVELVETTFVAGGWQKAEDVRALATAWSGRGWKSPAAYLESFVSFSKPQFTMKEHPPANLATAADSVLDLHRKLDRVRSSVENTWERIEAARKTIEDSGDKILEHFGEYVAAATSSDAGGAKGEGVEQLGKKLEAVQQLAASLEAFLKSDWAKVARETFWKDSPIHRNFDGAVTEHTLRQWLAEVKNYYVIGVPVDPVVAALGGVEADVARLEKECDPSFRQEVVAWAAKFRQGNFKQVTDQIDALRKGRYVKKDEGDLKARIADARRKAEKLQEEVNAAFLNWFGDPQRWLAGVLALKFPASAALNQEWGKRLKTIVGTTRPEELRSSPDKYLALRGKVERLQKALAKLGNDLPEGLPDGPAKLAGRPWYAAFASRTAAKREGQLQKGLQAIPWMGDVPDLAAPAFTTQWDAIAKAYQTWRESTGEVMVSVARIEDALKVCYLPDEKLADAGGKTLAQVSAATLKGALLKGDAALSAAVKPIADRMDALEAASALDDRKALVQAATRSRDRGVVWAAWLRLGKLQPAWPADLAELEADGKIQARLGSEFLMIEAEGRRTALRSKVAAEARRRQEGLLAKQIRTLEDQIKALTATIEGSGDPVLAQFGTFAQAQRAAAGADRAALPKHLDTLRALAARLGTFVKDEWDEIDRERFWKESTVHKTFQSNKTADRATFEAWLKQAPEYRRITIAEALQQIKTMATVATSPAINAGWVKRRDLLLLIYPVPVLQADRRLDSIVRRKFQDLAAFFKGLDDPGSLPAPPADWPPAFVQEGGKSREQALAKAIGEVPWAKDGFPAQTLGQFKQSESWRNVCADYNQFLSVVGRVQGDVKLVQRLVDGGYRPDDKPGDADKTLRQVFEQWDKQKVSQSLLQPFAATVQRGRAILGLEALQRAQLVARAKAIQPSDPPQVTMIVWERLGKTPDWPKDMAELQFEADLRGKVAAAAAKVKAKTPDAVAWVDGALAAEGPRRWETCFQKVMAKATPDAQGDALVGAALALAPKLAADVDKLSPRTRFWRLLHDFRAKAAALPESAKKDDLLGIVGAFDASVRGLGGGVAGQGDVAKLLADLKAVLEAAGDDAPGQGLQKTGPAASKVGTWKPTVSEDGKSANYEWSERPYKLSFVRVEPRGGGKAVYIGTTEVSVGLFIDLVGASQKWQDVAALLNVARLAGIDPRKGPRVWQPTRDGSSLQPSRYWLVKLPGVKPYPPDGKPKSPSRSHPMQYVSPDAALYVARLLGCRLPAATEWAGAFDAFEKAKGPGDRNLRDKTWQKQHAYTQTLVQGGRRADWPDAGIFVSPEAAGVKRGAAATSASTATDGELWFAKADESTGMQHLVGNVAEIVFNSAATFDEAFKDPAKVAADPIRGFLDQGAADLAVIGGSALSPPEQWNGADKPFDRALKVDLAAARQGYSDVGFRLAFTAPRDAPVSRVARVLKRHGYVTGLQ